ncbi:MAG: hypothetical protein BMS9Abin37_1154 [Acidobacteriota bacterium]|nr:MAG: hypothetical protein BMS9Abin37_1154 [Acidobacteriota bacterium]
MDITLSAAEAVIQQARKRAEAMGKSLHQLVREYLQLLASGSNVDDDIEALRRLSKEGRGNLFAVLWL